MELKEIYESKFKIISESKENSTIKIIAPWIKSDKKNKNGRTYRKSLLQREVRRVQEAIGRGSFVGSGDHNTSGHATLADASHVVKKLWMEDDGTGWAELEVVGTERGKNIMALIQAGATLGLSPKGRGSVGYNGKVLDDYQLLGLDIVIDPSEPTASFSKDNVSESRQHLSVEEKEKNRSKILTAYNESVQAGYSRTLEEWKAENPQRLKFILNEGQDSGGGRRRKEQWRQEAQDAGITDEADVKKYVENSEKIHHHDGRLTEEERHESEAKSLFEHMRRKGVHCDLADVKKLLETERKKALFETKRDRVRQQCVREYHLSGGSKSMTLEALVFKALEEEGLLTAEEQNYKFFRSLLVKDK